MAIENVYDLIQALTQMRHDQAVLVAPFGAEVIDDMKFVRSVETLRAEGETFVVIRISENL